VTDRLLLYPVLLVASLQLAVLAREPSWWVAVPLARCVIVLGVSGVALWTGAVGWAWAAFGGLMVAPRVIYRWAARCVKRGEVTRARRWRQVARFGVPMPPADAPAPAGVRGEAHLWRLWELVGMRQWPAAVACYENVAEWGGLGTAVAARLAVARAYAELGEAERAVRQLAVVALLPRVMGAFAKEYERTRQQVVRLTGAVPAVALLEHAEAQSAGWRDLLSWGRPGWVTAGVVGLLVVITAGNEWAGMRWILEFGNLPWTEWNGEWYRPVTALGLHAGWGHLGLNGAALWLFGAGLERARGWGWMATVFLVSGILANCASAAVGGFEVSVGASGGVFGLVGAFGVAVYRMPGTWHAGMRRQLLVGLGMVVAVDLLVGMFEPRIDQVAHVAGFATGLGLALVAGRTSRSPRPGGASR
jgi:membrane associated rhomboid family serine protease